MNCPSWRQFPCRERSDFSSQTAGSCPTSNSSPGATGTLVEWLLVGMSGSRANSCDLESQRQERSGWHRHWGIFFFFLHTMRHAGSWFSMQGWNPWPLQWKHRVLIIGQLEKSPLRDLSHQRWPTAWPYRVGWISNCDSMGQPEVMAGGQLIWSQTFSLTSHELDMEVDTLSSFVFFFFFLTVQWKKTVALMPNWCSKVWVWFMKWEIWLHSHIRSG